MEIVNNFGLIGTIVAILFLILFILKPKLWKLIMIGIGVFLVWLSKNIPEWMLKIFVGG